MANNSISRTGTFTSSGSAGGSGTYDYSGTSGYSGIDYYSNDDFKNESIFTDVSSKISIKFSEEIDNSSIKVFSKDTELPFDFQNKKGTVGLTHIVSTTQGATDDGNNLKALKLTSLPIDLTTIFLFLNLPPITVSPTSIGIVITSDNIFFSLIISI